MQALLILFFTWFILSFLSIRIFSWAFYKFNLLDNPIKYKKERAPIPYSMGVIFFVCFFILSYFFVDHNYKLYLLWIFWGIITIVSFIDDRLNISPKIRLLIQIIIGWIIWLTAIKVWYVSNIFWWIIDLDTFFIEIFQYKIYIISLLFTIFWYVFIFNALNWTDGIQWNTSGLSLISFFVLFLLWLKLYFTDEYIWWVENAKFILSLSIILISILIPFFYFDFKEKILMWDSWTMFLWFILASLAIISWWKIATVLVVFWIYAIDAIYVIVTRLKNKKNPLSWDFTHLHHRLLDLGMSKNQVLAFLFSFSFLFWVSSLFLNREWKILLFVFMIFFVIFSPKILSKFLNYEKK